MNTHQEFPDSVEYSMASILFQESDLIKKLEEFKKEFHHFDNFSEVIIP